MQFHIDVDSQNAIGGWVALDNPADIPLFCIKISGRPDINFEPNWYRPDVVDLGFHATGQVGFAIDENMIPDIAEVRSLKIFETTTGVIIYCRLEPETMVQKRLLLIDSSVFPQINFVRTLAANFGLQYPMVERYSLETAYSILTQDIVKSAFVSGALNWMRAAGPAQASQFVTAALLRDPFEELAERFLFLKHLDQVPSTSLTSSILERHQPVLSLLRGMDFQDRKTIIRPLRNMSREQQRLLRSPMTYAYGAAPDDQLQRRNVSVALDHLSQFSLVGIREYFDGFAESLAGLIGVDSVRDAELVNLSGMPELARELMEIGTVCDLLDEDIALYSFVKKAVEKVSSEPLDNLLTLSQPSGEL